MRILCTLELDPSQESIYYLRLTADALRKKFVGSEVVFATNSPARDMNLLWADKVFVSPKVMVESKMSAPGPWGLYHSCGWTAENLRQDVYSTWAQLIRALKPDVVIACNSPSVVLVSVFEEVKCIQVGDGRYIPELSDWGNGSENFPEFAAWVDAICDRPIGEAVNVPALIFTAQAIDRPRTGVKFNVLPELGDYSPRDSSADVIAFLNKDEHEAAEIIALASESIGSKFELRSNVFEMDSCAGLGLNAPLIIGHYDSFWLSHAISRGSPYMGLLLNGKGMKVRERALAAGVALDASTARLTEFFKSPDLFNTQFGLDAELRGQQCCAISVALEYLL